MAYTLPQPIGGPVSVLQRAALGSEPLHQRLDLVGREAAVAAQGLHIRQLLQRRPARDRLGGHVQQRRHFLRQQIVGLVRRDHTGPPSPDNTQDRHLPGDRAEYTGYGGAHAGIGGQEGARDLPTRRYGPFADGHRRVSRRTGSAHERAGTSGYARPTGTTGGDTGGAQKICWDFPAAAGGLPPWTSPVDPLRTASDAPPELESSGA